MTKRSTKILVGVLAAILFVGFLFFARARLSWVFDGSEYDFVSASDSSAECFRVSPSTVALQIKVADSDGDGLEFSSIHLIDGNGLAIDGAGLVSSSEPPLTNGQAVTRTILAGLTEPKGKYFPNLSATGEERAFLILDIQMDSTQARAAGLQFEWVPGEPVYIDTIGFDLDISSSSCTITDVTG